jgi:thioredoxin 1
MSEILDVNDDSFDREVLQSERPVLVDFWGDHCPACLQITPILEELARERVGNARIVKVHASENVRASSQYGVRAMPTVLAFFQGTVHGQLVGARPKSAFVDLLEAIPR